MVFSSSVSNMLTILLILRCRNYPSWLFVESAANSSSDDVGSSDPDLDCGGDEIELVTTGVGDGEDCTENNCAVEHEDSEDDSEDEGWYSLSRTDVRKLQDVRNTSEHVNIILTNPADILHLPQTSIFISQSGICCEDVEEDEEEPHERNEESSPERTSYRYLCTSS